MWRSNMAARKRGEESDLAAGDSEFPSRNTLNELVLSRSQDVDHSILSIFEDSTVSPESHNGAEEENESLLCALTEMLDRVGQDDDDDGIFSPFDVLPNTELLHRAEHTDEPRLQEPSPSFRLRPRPKPPNETSRTRSDGEQKVERNGRPQMLKKQNQKLFSSKNRRAKAEVEVFTSTSLVSLVKLMHPYCLKLHVEKEDDPRKNKSLFSQEEVWRYERPSEDGDEEINVVSEDETPSKQTEEEEEGGSRGDGTLLKSVLLNGKTSREKKRVSFGPVHVASFDESEEEEIEEKSRKTLEEPSGSALQPSAQTSEGNNGEQEKKKGETRTKSLSLQEYRQLRLNRRPPVEEHRNYTTRWPSVSELPKELPPILPLHKPNTAAEFSTFTQHVKLKEAKLHNHLHHRRLKSSKPEPRTSPASPPPDHSATPSSRKPDSRSPVKKPKLVSSDPPNPVLVRLRSNKHSQQIQNESPALYERSSEPKLSTSPPNDDSKAVDTQLLQEVNAKLTEMPPPVYPESPQHLSRAERPSSPDIGFTAITPRLHQPPTEGHMMSQEEFTDSTEPEPPQNDCRENSAADQSGIEAADLTSLLEQFEETQAIDNSLCNNGPQPVPAASSSSSESNCRVGLDRPEPEGPELTCTSPLKPTVGPLEPRSPGDALKDVQSLDVPEPLHTEVVLSTQRNPPTRCRSLSLKLVQIIEPRPLPTRKVRTSQSEPPAAAHSSAQIYAYLCCDHDYCGSAERCPPQAQQLAEATTEPERTADQVSENRRSDQTRTGSETDTSTDEALRFSPRKAADRGGRDDNRAALCGLPTPPPTPPGRGRSRRRYRVRSPRSDSGSSSSSCSCSPKRPRIRRRRSESSSCSSSPSSCASPPRRHRAARSRSRSRSWSQSRSRSSSPQIYHRRWRDVSASRESRRRSREREMRIQKLKAIDERRVVYVGRIRRTMTHDELRERFSQFGEVECVSLHFRDGSDHYGFVTFYSTEDAFAAIDNGGKLRQPDELPFDLCFGGRRQFCNSDYADLDANREAEPPPPRSRFEDLDFDSLLKQAQRGLKR